MKKVLLLLTLLPLIVSAQVKRTIHVETAGTLPTLISEEEKYEIEELTLSGELNGTDFKFIREMAGVNDKVCKVFDGDWVKWVEYIPTEGILKSLNLAESKIVSGGEPYYYEGDKPITGSAWIEKYYTASDAISSYLFARTILENIILPNSIISIGTCVFYNCNRLTTITIPNSVTTIDYGVFIGSYLTSIQVENGNNKYDSRNNCNAIIDNNNQLIAGCKTTIIPNNVTSIGDAAFSGCSGLTSVTIGNDVTSIGDGAFSGCSGLTSVTIGNNMTSIGDYAFSDCSSLTSITIPNSVTSIGDFAFSGCSGLTSVTIGNDVISIGDYSFYGCSGLTSITIPNSVTSIGWEAFANCSGLTSITIGNNVTTIRRGAFSGCSALATSIKVESGNQTYDSRNNCNAIIETASNTLILGCKNTAIPNTVTSIGYNAFRGSSGLTSITIPNSVTSIGSEVFADCTGLIYITLPSKLTSIGDCLYGCNNLAYIYCNAKDVPSVVNNSLGNTGNITLYVPSESIEAYKSTSPWSKFNVQTNTNLQSTEKCSKPKIGVVDGKVTLDCEMSGVTYHWGVSSPSGTNGETNNSSIGLLPITIYVFATKYGYQNSDVATYMFSGLDGDVNSDGEVNVADHVKLSEIIMGQ